MDDEEEAESKPQVPRLKRQLEAAPAHNSRHACAVPEEAQPSSPVLLTGMSRQLKAPLVCTAGKPSARHIPDWDATDTELRKPQIWKCRGGVFEAQGKAHS